jgi:hypothetical protein
MKLNLEILIEKEACEPGIDWYRKYGKPTVEETFTVLMEHKEYRYCSWMLMHVALDSESIVKYTRFAADCYDAWLADVCDAATAEAVPIGNDNVDVTARNAATAAKFVADTDAKWIKTLNYGLSLIVNQQQ